MKVKVLIIKLSSIGDVVHTLPALRAIKEGFWKRGMSASIDWLVEEEASGILEGHPLIDELIVVRNRGWLRNPAENMARARRMASKGYDIVIDFQGLLKSGVWVLLTRGRRKVGFSNARELSHVFLNEKLPAYDPDRHAVLRYMDLARHVSGYAGGISFPVHAGPETESSVLRLLRESGVGEGDDFFVMVPTARWDTKLWSIENFSEFAREARRRFDARAVLVGARGDWGILEEIRLKSGSDAVNLAGRTTLKDLYVLTAMARFVLTLDSGPMHIAAAAGARVVALFGPTAPWRTGPYGEGNTVIRKVLECSPCFKKGCAEPRCMDGISTGEVLEAVERIFEPEGGKAPSTL